MSHIFGIKIGCWNIQGLNEDKRSDKAVLDFINNNDCAIFVETWVNSCFDFSNHYTYCLLAQRSKHGRSKGGIVVSMRHNIRNGVKILESTESHLQWLKFDKTFFKLNNDVYVCVVYIPPIDSYKNVNDRDILWEKIEENILKYKIKGDIMIIGDFNSRTAKLNETPEYNDALANLKECFQVEPLVNRNSRDNSINQFGKRLLDLCCHTNLNILNGRTIGDVNGQLTSYHYNGASVIDYCIVNRELYTNILYFTVSDPSHISDHSVITVCVEGSTFNTNDIIEDNYYVCPKGFKWNNSSEKYKNVLNTPLLKNKLKYIENCNYTADSDGINLLCTDITSLLCEAGRCSLKISKGKTKNKPQTKWYNNSLYGIKCSITHLAKLLGKYPNDPYIRGKFISKKKEYNKYCRKAKRDYFKTVASDLEKIGIKSPKEFWRMLNYIKPSNNENGDLPSMAKLLDHFKGHYQRINENNSTTDNNIDKFCRNSENNNTHPKS
jgi:hypothetical protein